MSSSTTTDTAFASLHLRVSAQASAFSITFTCVSISDAQSGGSCVAGSWRALMKLRRRQRNLAFLFLVPCS